MTSSHISLCTVTPKAFKEQIECFDQAVLETPDIATFCSGSDWILTAHETLHPPRPMHAWCRDGHWLLASMGELPPFARVLQPLEMTWAFGCPLSGPDPSISLQILFDVIREPHLFWQVIMLTGIPENSTLWSELQQRLEGRYAYEVFEGADCIQSHINEGADAFLSCRSSKFRANLRRSERQADQHGITYELITDFSDPDTLFQRMMQVEQSSWKFASGRSIFLIGRYRAFYEKLLHRLTANGRLRLLFAQQDGQDVAYVFGGVLGSVYRGFQLSYDNNFAAYSLGHLVQWQMIQQLAQESVELYDLGMVMDYKKRWADHTLKLLNVVIFSPHF